MGTLAAAEQVRPPTVTRMVKDLEYEGLVRRRPSPDDARVQLVAATAKGRRLLDRGRARRVSALAEHLGDLSAADRRIVRQAAEILLKAFG